jgi:multidrug efflux system membrane fusion protein
MNPQSPTGLEPDTHVRPPLPQDTKTPPKHGKGRGWLWLVVLAGLAAGAYFYWQRSHGASTGTTPAPDVKTGKKGRGMGGPPPVVAVRAKRGGIGVYVDGLGTVTPIYTVTVRSRVDGQLMEIRYKEGDLVRKGDPLLEIDPRPYQV